METHLNNAIHRTYYMLKLNIMVLIGIVCGGCVLSSITAAITVHKEANHVSGLLHFRQWWKTFVQELKVTGCISWAYNVWFILILWALWFTSQFKGLIFLAAWLVQLAVLVLSFLAVLAEANLRQYYEGNAFEILKLSWIQLFMSPKANFATLLLWIVLSLLLIQAPAVVGFWGFGVWISFTSSLYAKEWSRLNIL